MTEGLPRGASPSCRPGRRPILALASQGGGRNGLPTPHSSHAHTLLWERTERPLSTLAQACHFPLWRELCGPVWTGSESLLRTAELNL